MCFIDLIGKYGYALRRIFEETWKRQRTVCEYLHESEHLLVLDMWRKRWFSLRIARSSSTLSTEVSPKLYYYKTDKDVEPLGIIDFQIVTSVKRSSPKKQGTSSIQFISDIG